MTIEYCNGLNISLQNLKIQDSNLDEKSKGSAFDWYKIDEHSRQESNDLFLFFPLLLFIFHREPTIVVVAALALELVKASIDVWLSLMVIPKAELKQMIRWPSNAFELDIINNLTHSCNIIMRHGSSRKRLYVFGLFKEQNEFKKYKWNKGSTLKLLLDQYIL